MDQSQGAAEAASMLGHGAYVLDRDASAGDPEIILIASGSEVALIVKAAELLKNAGVRARLVSMPSWRLFEEQSAEYREGVLPARIRARLSVEAASPLGWERWVGLEGAIMRVSRFGASTPGPKVLQEYGFTAQRVADAAAALRSHTRAG
ncbi:transketolase C-terminal domain-containing protein [Sorangium sp. So ce269]